MHDHSSGNTKFFWGPMEVSIEACKIMHAWKVWKPDGSSGNAYPLEIGKVNRIKHQKIGTVEGNGHCDGGSYTAPNGQSYSDYIVNQYFTIKLETFSTQLIDGVAVLPLDKVSDKTSSYDVDLGTFYSTSAVNPIDKYQQLYRGSAMGPNNLGPGSTLVIKDPIRKKYAAVQLTDFEYLAGKYKVYGTTNNGLYIRVMGMLDSYMPIKEVTAQNAKIDLALSTVGQYIITDGNSRMKKIYDKLVHDACVQERTDLAVSSIFCCFV